jgi:hypothetical protein
VAGTIVNIGCVQFVSDELAQLYDGIYYGFYNQAAAVIQDRGSDKFRQKTLGKQT